jgi:hypothetical protein
MKADPFRWDKAWEKALRTISPYEDVFPMLGCMWRRDLFKGDDAGFKYMIDGTHYWACTSQENLSRWTMT